MTFNFKPLLLSAIAASILFGCGSTSGVISTPIENIDTLPLKISKLTENQKRVWGHLDLVQDTVPGMSVDKAYNEIIKNKKGQTTIVAVIDSGIDIDHEDLDDVIWINTKEIANNGKDDDNNGYIDDIHGWNFLGDAYDEQLEYVRLLASGDKSNPRYQEAQAEYEKDYQNKKELNISQEEIIESISKFQLQGETLSFNTIGLYFLETFGIKINPSIWIATLEENQDNSLIMPNSSIISLIDFATKNNRVGEAVLLILIAADGNELIKFNPFFLQKIITSLDRLGLGDKVKDLIIETLIL